MHDVIKKCKFKNSGLVLYAPPAIAEAFVKQQFKTSYEPNTQSANTLIFVKNRESLLNSLKNDLANVERDSILWLAYPKGTSKIATDINRDSIRATAETFGLSTVSAISIDDTWSALRFRPTDRVGT